MFVAGATELNQFLVDLTCILPCAAHQVIQLDESSVDCRQLPVKVPDPMARVLTMNLEKRVVNIVVEVCRYQFEQVFRTRKALNVGPAGSSQLSDLRDCRGSRHT